MEKVILFTDGGARGNPGPAAAGMVIQDAAGKIILQKGVYLGRLTNNQAEYQALILGLQAAARFTAKEVVIYLDSELIARQLERIYQVKSMQLQPLYATAQKLLSKFGRMRLHHVRRTGNKLADKIVNQTLDRKGKQP